MVVFYRGAGVNTYWHEHDARERGFVAKAPGQQHSLDRLKQHIARGNFNSPYISLSRSYGIARDYAKFLGRAEPSAAAPAYVYEIELSQPLPSGLALFDPVRAKAEQFGDPLAAAAYHHDGDSKFLLGVADPTSGREFLELPVRHPPPADGGARRSPNLSIELEAMVRALRDAEILARGVIPTNCIRARYNID
jgi:hypothetical protein